MLLLCTPAIVNSINHGSGFPALCSDADQRPESSVMPSGSALSVGRSEDLYRCLSSSLSNVLLLKICCPPVGVFLKVSAVRPLMRDQLI